MNNDYIRQGNNLINRYRRHDIEDSAYARFNQQLEFLYQDYGYSKIPKNPQHKAGQDEFNKELDDLMQELVDSNEKLIDIFTNPHGRFKEFKKNHKGATKQDYIDYIEDSRAFFDEMGDLLELDSEQIHAFYDIGRKKNMTTAEVNKVIKDTYMRNIASGKTLDRLSLNIRRNLRRYKKEDSK